MIQIFNGRSRGLGQDAQHAVYVQVSVALRQHLHHFKGARLGVFLAIALHSNADGWAWPSMAVLRAETGHNVQTIAQALRDLCVLTIDGQHVLLAVQDRAAGGTFATNRYLLFPSDEDVACYAGETDDPHAAPPADVPQIAAPSSEKPSTEKPSTVAPDTAQPSSEKAHVRNTILYLWVHRTCICHQEAILAMAHALVTAIGGTRIRFRMFGILHIGARKQIATI